MRELRSGDSFLASAVGHARNLDRGERSARPDAEHVDSALESGLDVEKPSHCGGVDGPADVRRRDRVDQGDHAARDLELADVVAARVRAVHITTGGGNPAERRPRVTDWSAS